MTEHEERFATCVKLASSYIDVKTGYIADVIRDGFVVRHTVQMARAQLFVMIAWKTAGDIDEMHNFKRHVKGAIKAADAWLRLEQARANWKAAREEPCFPWVSSSDDVERTENA